MPKVYNMVNIDSNKLREEIKKRGVTYRQASCNVGCSEDYFYNAFYTKRMKYSIVKMLDMIYNIKPEAYVQKPEEPAERPVNEEIPNNGLDWQRLHNVIYEAVYNAFKNVMSE